MRMGMGRMKGKRGKLIFGVCRCFFGLVSSSQKCEQKESTHITTFVTTDPSRVRFLLLLLLFVCFSAEDHAEQIEAASGDHC